MAPKQPEEKPHIPSSSEEDESGSSEEQSESTREVSKKDDSSDDENESKPTQTSVVVPVSTKKLEPDSESESESESDSEPIQNLTSGSITTKSTLPESSTNKRKETEDVLDVQKNKKMKTGDGEVKKISGDEAKLMFQRLFSESDEIALLQGILDFNAKKGDYHKEMDAFVDYVKKLINFNANRSQLKTKIQRLRKKFANIVKNSLKKGKNEDEIVFSKDLDQKAFELSRQIWGNNGVQVSKSRKKKHEEETPREFKLMPHSSKKRQETVKAAEAKDTGLELSSFFKTENVTAFSLDESALSAVWGTVKDGSKKREMEERLKKLKAKQGVLCMQRTGLVADSAKLIFKDKASSSSGM